MAPEGPRTEPAPLPLFDEAAHRHPVKARDFHREISSGRCAPDSKDRVTPPNRILVVRGRLYTTTITRSALRAAAPPRMASPLGTRPEEGFRIAHIDPCRARDPGEVTTASGPKLT